MTWRKLLALSMVITTVGLTDFVSADVAPSPSAIMVIPARYRMVEFAFDMARLRDVAIVSYQNDAAKPSELLLHVWNGRQWMHVTAESYRSGSFLLGAPKHLILIGGEGMVPDVLTAAPEWCARVERITAMDISTLVNTLGKLLKFNDSEWLWFSDKYDLSIADLNSERRRYGRWGSPEQEKAREESYMAAKKAAKAQGKSTVLVKPAATVGEEVPEINAAPVNILPEPVKVEPAPAPAATPVSSAAPVPQEKACCPPVTEKPACAPIAEPTKAPAVPVATEISKPVCAMPTTEAATESAKPACTPAPCK